MRRVALVVLAALLLAFPVGRGQEPKKGDDKKPEAARFRTGTVRDAKGKAREFEFMRGVRIHPDAFDDEKHLHFYDGRDSFIVPLADLAGLEIGKEETMKASVLLKAKDKKEQTLTVELGTSVEVKWKGDVAITRTQWRTFEGGKITFDK